MSDLDARQSANNDLDGGARVPAWKLREQMKKASHPTTHVRKTPPYSKPKPQDDIDPSLPPAFKAMCKAQRKKKSDLDDFNSLDSVHSSKSYQSMTKTPTTKNDSDSYGSDSDSSFDGHDSFASLGGDESDDDEAYRESKNMLAKQELESNASNTVRNRLKKAGMNTLDLIAE